MTLAVREDLIDMLTPVRRRIAAAALVLTAPALTACGFGYQTDQVYQPGVGVNDRSGTVDILGAVVVRTADQKGTLVASLVNNDADQDDELVSVTGDGLEGKVASPVKIPGDSLVNLASTGAVSVNGERVANGNFVRVTLEFQSGQKTTVNIPVVPKDDEFSDVKSANASAASAG